MRYAFIKQHVPQYPVRRLCHVMAVNRAGYYAWRKEPVTAKQQEVIVHSDQGSQFSSYDWQDFLKAHNLIGSMSRRGNCYDNAVTESFFQLLKRERIKRGVYADREETRSDVFDYIEMFYNPKRRHGYNDRLSPVEFERWHFMRQESV